MLNALCLFRAPDIDARGLIIGSSGWAGQGRADLRVKEIRSPPVCGREEKRRGKEGHDRARQKLLVGSTMKTLVLLLLVLLDLGLTQKTLHR